MQERPTFYEKNVQRNPHGAQALITSEKGDGGFRYVIHNGRELVQASYHVIDVQKEGALNFYKGRKSVAIGIPLAKKIVNAYGRFRHVQAAAFVSEMSMGKMFKMLGLNE